ncbi:6-phosphofructokinase [bacterium]|nr:6-phosphofructokinase [bacterium]
MKKIGVLTSGGDCSGMNAAIRSTVRTALTKGLEVVGIRQGFVGLLDKLYFSMDSKSVSNILQHAGTILQTARCEEFKFERGQKQAVRTIEELGIDGLVIIGGNGSLTGALALHHQGIKVIGIPATIDNDLFGTDMAIGVDTALNTIVTAIDIIRDTASSHDRAFIIEVMGRESGYLALMAAIASGAEAAIIPEVPCDLGKIAQHLLERYKAGKTNSLIIVAEGASSAYTIERKLKGSIGYETRITVLGHIQRGGVTTVFDRLLASNFGMLAVKALLDGKSGEMTALQGNNYSTISLEEVISKKKKITPELLELAKSLSS